MRVTSGAARALAKITESKIGLLTNHPGLFKGLRKWQFDVWSNDVTLANHLESGGLAGRVHVSQTTADCLDGAYELEPAEGHLRDGYIRQAGIRTYFIQPSGSQSSSRASNAQKTTNQVSSKPRLSLVRGIQIGRSARGRGGRSSAEDDDEDIDEEYDEERWEPEIPFMNLNAPEFKTAVPDLLVQAESTMPMAVDATDSKASANRVDVVSGDSMQRPQPSRTVGSLLRSSFRRRGRSTSGQTRNALHLSSFKTMKAEISAEEQPVQLVPTADLTELDGTEVGEKQALNAQAEDRPSSSVCIRIVDTTGETEPPINEISNEPSSGADQLVSSSSSVIVSCPLGGDTTTSLRQPASAPSNNASHGYVILFSRLLCSKIRRTGCCGLGRSRRTANETRTLRRELTRCSSSSFESTVAAKPVEPQTSNSLLARDASSIEVEISRRMMKEHINWFRLTFKSSALENAYRQIRYTTSKSNIVYIFVTWLLMSLVALCSLPNWWETVKVFLLATVPLAACACFYMSDSILYSRYMSYKLKEAAATSLASRPSTVSNSNQSADATSTRGKQVPKQAEQAPAPERSSVDRPDAQRHVGSLVHRVAKFWSKLDRIPMIWNVFILVFNLVMTVAFLRMNYFTCKLNQSECTPADSSSSNFTDCRLPVATGQQEYVCFNHESLIFNVVLILIEVGAFYRSSYLRKVILLLLVTTSFAAFFTWLNLSASSPTQARLVDKHDQRSAVSWPLFNVALDQSVCPLARPSRAPLPPPSETNITRSIGLDVIAPQTLMTVSQCDPKLLEKSYIIIAFIFLGLVYVCRSTERISRLDFLWKLQASKELQDIRALRHYNTQLLENILPDHVAAHFLKDERDSEELYAKSYNCVAVLFASIPNFSSFYSEDINNGMECIRLLNEIIFDFDQLLEDERFKSLEKVKTISSTYLAACGLNPRDQSLPPSYHLSVCCKFAFAMKRALNEVNVHSFNNFVMRIGISQGPLVGGVIGAKKPVFDIWGDTVNEASRMDSTGSLDMIQVPKSSADILAQVGFKVKCRGVIPVKGKGNMETYYVMEEPRGDQQICPDRPTAATSELEENSQSTPADTQEGLVQQRLTVIQNVREGVELGVSPEPDVQIKHESERKERVVQPSQTDNNNNNNNASPDKLFGVDKGDQLMVKLSAPSGVPAQPKRFSRHSRNTQSLRYPSSSAGNRLAAIKRPQLRARELTPVGGRTDPELNRLMVADGTSDLGGSRGLVQERLRSVSPLNLIEPQRVFDRLLDYRAASSVDPSQPAQSSALGGCSASEDGSLAAVVYNMVQMRKSYDPKLTRLAASSSTGPHGSCGGADSSGSTAPNAHSLGRDESSARLTGLSIGAGSSRLLKGQQSSLIARPKSAQNSDNMHRSMRSRASFFRRRPNYRRAGTSEVGTELTGAEDSIHENE